MYVEIDYGILVFWIPLEISGGKSKVFIIN